MPAVARIPPMVPQDRSWVYEGLEPRRAIGWLEIGSDTNEKRNGRSRTSRARTEDESMGEVGVEMLDGKVVSEVHVGGLDSGST